MLEMLTCGFQEPSLALGCGFGTGTGTGSGLTSHFQAKWHVRRPSHSQVAIRHRYQATQLVWYLLQAKLRVLRASPFHYIAPGLYVETSSWSCPPARARSLARSLARFLFFCGFKAPPRAVRSPEPCSAACGSEESPVPKRTGPDPCLDPNPCLRSAEAYLRSKNSELPETSPLPVSCNRLKPFYPTLLRL